MRVFQSCLTTSFVYTRVTMTLNDGESTWIEAWCTAQLDSTGGDQDLARP
jgi:hypothetical protein